MNCIQPLLPLFNIQVVWNVVAARKFGTLWLEDDGQEYFRCAGLCNSRKVLVRGRGRQLGAAKVIRDCIKLCRSMRENKETNDIGASTHVCPVDTENKGKGGRRRASFRAEYKRYPAVSCDKQLSQKLLLCILNKITYTILSPSKCK